MKSFLTIFNSLPAILQSVQMLETAIPIPQTGKQKLDLVMNAALTAWGASQVQQQMSQSQLLNSVAAITNLTVATMNATGMFKSTGAAAAVAPATTQPVSSK